MKLASLESLQSSSSNSHVPCARVAYVVEVGKILVECKITRYGVLLSKDPRHFMTRAIHIRTLAVRRRGESTQFINLQAANLLYSTPYVTTRYG